MGATFVGVLMHDCQYYGGPKLGEDGGGRFIDYAGQERPCQRLRSQEVVQMFLEKTKCTYDFKKCLRETMKIILFIQKKMLD